jgi:hypothetical protein
MRDLINYLKDFKNDASALYKLVDKTPPTGIREDLFDSIKKDLLIKKFIDKKTKQFMYVDGQQFIDEIKEKIGRVKKQSGQEITLIDSTIEILLSDLYKSYIKSPAKEGKQEVMED